MRLFITSRPNRDASRRVDRLHPPGLSAPTRLRDVAALQRLVGNQGAVRRLASTYGSSGGVSSVPPTPASPAQIPPAPAAAPAAQLTFASRSFTPTVKGALDIHYPRPLLLRFHTFFEIKGQAEVRGGTDGQAQQWDAGCLQTVLASRTAGRFVDQAGTCLTKLAFSVPRAARDGTAGVTPWYLQAWVKPFAVTGSAEDTYMNDNPDAAFPSAFSDPMIGGGARYMLDQTEGEDRFAAWQVVRNRLTGEIRHLKWVTWRIDWAAARDPATGNWRGTGVGSDITGQGNGIGNEVPILTDPVARDTTVTSEEPC